MSDPPRITDRDFFTGDAARLARGLLGRVLVRRLETGETLAGVIVETEAYLGARDAASHAFGNRRTARTEPMFAQPGTAYVYFTYGMHHCMNVVCGQLGVPAAVLIRALRPIAGIERMRCNRFHDRGDAGARDANLCSGPAKLCAALNIDKRFSGVDLVISDELWLAELADGWSPKPAAIASGPRIGVEYAGEWAAKPLRFWVSGDANVSRPRAPRPRGKADAGDSDQKPV